MKYENKWEKLELEGDSNRITKKKKLVSSISGLSVSDVLIINEWLNYANIIEDKSFYDIGLELTHSKYIHKKMSHQTEFRRKQFIC